MGRQRALDLFAPAYLQLIGVIQSLALALLIQGWDLEHAGASTWLQAVATTITIIVIWHEYVTSLMTFRWVVDFVDSLIPFALGLAQFITIRSIGEQTLSRWLFAMALTAGVGAAAYAAQYWHARREIQENQKALAAVDYKKLAILPAAALAGFYALSGTIVICVAAGYGLAFLIAAIALLVGFIALRWCAWSKLSGLQDQH